MKFQFEPIDDENVFEEFSKDLLNFYYETDTFQKYKTKGATQHGIDLFSPKLKIVVQCKKKKLQRADKTIINELIDDFNESIKLLAGFQHDFGRLILISTSKKYGEIQDYSFKLSQENKFEVIFWSWEDIEPFVIKFDDLRNKYYPHLWHNVNTSYPKILTYLPKIAISEIIGRDNEIQILKNALAQNNKAIIINGIGGIGKSSIAKLYVHNTYNDYDHILWVDDNSFNDSDIDKTTSIIDSFITNTVLINNLKISLQENFTPLEKMLLILNKIQNIHGNNLLVIDGASNDIMQYFESIPGKPNWNVLLTSRDKFSNHYELNITSLDDEFAERLFYSHYKIERNNNIHTLFEQIGNHTLTIELYAKTANKRNILIDDLVKAINDEGLNISKVANVRVDHQLNKDLINPFDYLNRIFSIVKLSKEEIEILNYFSVLPSLPINYSDLKLIFQIPSDDNDFFELISELVSSGWINHDKNHYWMHQVIQAVIRNKLKPNFKSCELLIGSLSKLLKVEFDENPLNKINYVLLAENVAQFIKDEENLIMVNFLMTLGLREGDLSNFSKDIYFQNRALVILENNFFQNLEHLATCYNNLQHAYKELGEVDKALACQLTAVMIQEKTLDKFHPDLGTSYNNLSLIYQILGKIEEAYNFQKKAIIIAENALDSNHPHLANAYSNFSLLLYDSDYLEEAIIYQEKSFKIRQAILPESHPNIAEGYGNLGMMYYADGRHKLGREYLEKSIELKKSNYSDTHYSLGTAYNNLASIYLNESEFLKAEDVQKKAIQIEEAFLGINHFTLAVTHSTMAVIQLKLGNLDKAKESVFKSISITEFNFPEGHDSLNTYRNFLKHIDNM